MSMKEINPRIDFIGQIFYFQHKSANKDRKNAGTIPHISVTI